MTLLCGGTVTFAGSSSSENAPKFGSWGIDLSAMDKSVKPGDDFFMYVNGTWYRSAIIPPDRVSTGVSDDIEIRTENRLKGIIAALAAKPYDSLSTDEKKLRDLYDAYVDQKTIDAAGLTPAKSDLDFIAGLKTLDDVASAMGRPDLGLAGPLSLDIDADPSIVSDAAARVIHATYPRLAMARELVGAIVAQVHAKPSKAPAYTLPAALVRERDHRQLTGIEQAARSGRWGE